MHMRHVRTGGLLGSDRARFGVTEPNVGSDATRVGTLGKILRRELRDLG